MPPLSHRDRNSVILLAIVGLLHQTAWTSAAATTTPDHAALPPAATITVDFKQHIQPLLEEHCVSCHGEEKQKGGLRLDNKKLALQGGDGGKILVAGQGAESRIVHFVAGLDPDEIMPPKGQPLSPVEVGLLRAWIDQGADWPDDGKAAVIASDHWSLQPIKAHSEAGPSPSALDGFITARLARDGLALSPEADRPTLIRRLSFDLTGLPPSPEEIDDFVNDSSPEAYGRLVDRLLATPHYGERWGRHWLDAARYTESQGFEYDQLRSNAWHYRDYVIKSFNEDKPYDRFMREQVAGDVIDPVTSDSIVATSLLVCGPWDQAGNAQANATQRAVTREDEMEDLLGVVGQSFLGLTINCARCHAHKSDPIPHEDYYRMRAVFDGVKHGERSITGADELKAHQAQREKLQEQLTAATAQVSAIEAVGAARAQAATAQPVLPPPAGPAPLLRWDFSLTGDAAPAGTLSGGAVIANGRLQLPKHGAFFQSPPVPSDIREKTLEAWVSLASLEQGGGAAISIENADGKVFDAIVFAERQPKKWMAGSDGYARTIDLDIPEEPDEAGTLVHMAIVYQADNKIALFRNGEPLGQPYQPASPLVSFAAGDARILLGQRHTGGGRSWLTGEIKQASVYDRALSPDEVAASFRSGGHSVPLKEILAHLTPEQRAARDEALATRESVRSTLAALPPPDGGVSYVGTRTEPPPARRLIRGEVNSPDEVVTPGALSAITSLNPDFGLPADAPEAARRQKFADWLTDPRHPLPARVMANRIWHHHFGQGLVATPTDFGVSGARPTHPELLDWLASRFIEGGWSVKSLHRLIVHSATYRQTADFNEKAAALDADNTLLWRQTPRRLEAEAVRDAMLTVSGQLNRAIGGPSFRPFDAIPFPANTYAIADKIGPEFNRRTVYRMNVNSGKDPLLDAFDCPDPSVKTPRRSVTTTPLQALGLMNSSFVQRQANHLAERATEAAPQNLEAAVTAAWRLALGRPPTEAEASRATAAARDRGLSSVCWALLNSTEFVYVR